MKKIIESEKPQLGNVKDELFFISFIILCAGLVFTDSYYQRFGFRYQLLDLSAMHIIYKGLTMIINSPLMLIPYSLTVGLILFEILAIRKGFKFFLMMRTPITYLFLVVNFLIIFPLSINAGAHQAMIDMRYSSSGLPKIKTLNSKVLVIDSLKKNDKYLLFMIDGDFVTVFTALNENEKKGYPIIKRIPKSEIELLETTI